MKIKSIKPIGKREVYDIQVENTSSYVLANGVISHNSGASYSANQIIFVSKSQEKDGKELLGYNFNLIAEKSRFVREKSRIPLQVKFEGGITKWSGLFELAKELEWITMPSSGWYTVTDKHTGEVIAERKRAKEIENDDDFWNDMFARGFDDDIKARYQLSSTQIIDEHEQDEE